MMMIVIVMMIASYTNDDDSHHDDDNRHHDDDCIVHSSNIYYAANFVPNKAILGVGYVYGKIISLNRRSSSFVFCCMGPLSELSKLLATGPLYILSGVSGIAIK